jgi:hypothetical protein
MGYLTSWSIVLFEKIMAAQLVKKFLEFYEMRKNEGIKYKAKTEAVNSNLATIKFKRCKN